jgi:hypothetical protein
MAEEKSIPIYVLRANSENQMEQALAEYSVLSGSSGKPSIKTVSARR